MLSLPSCLVPLKRNGQCANFRVSISPLSVVNVLSFDVAFCVLWHFNVPDGNWRG